MFGSPAIRRRLERAHPALFIAFAMVAAFSTYFSMYAFRKPFTAGTYAELAPIALPFVGVVSYKTLLIITQVLGYCTSKFLGIKIISEMTPARRAWAILACIGVAWGALLLFALIPAPYNIAMLFINGLPLGMIWGLVFGFLEGRRVSEPLGAGLSASYILASGAVKSIGRWMVVDLGVPEFWMPFATGALFVVPMLVVVFMLASLPPPSAEDEAARSPRVPMDAQARKAFFLAYLPGLLPLTLLYIVLTAYRDIRDNFAVELWAAVGYAEEPAIIGYSEIPVAFGVMLALALLLLIRDNRTALVVVHAFMATGTFLVGSLTLGWELGYVSPEVWMIGVGFGLYLAYVPYGCVLFDRLFAAVGAVGTAGFLIYVTDAFGYFGAVCLMLYKDLGAAEISWLSFFTTASYATAIVCTSLYLISMAYFTARTRRGARSAAA